MVQPKVAPQTGFAVATANPRSALQRQVIPQAEETCAARTALCSVAGWTRVWVRSARENSYVVGFRLFGTYGKFGPFRESGYSALRAASVRTPQLLRPDRSFTYPVLRVKKVIS